MVCHNDAPFKTGVVKFVGLNILVNTDYDYTTYLRLLFDCTQAIF